MKKIIAWIIIIIIIFTISPAIKEYYDFTSESGTEVTVKIPAGAASDDIAAILKDNGLIKYTTTFRLKVRLSQYNGKLRYGTFRLNDGMCMRDIIKMLATGGENTDTITFTVPEGFSVENIASRAQSLGICSKEDFLKALDDSYDYEFLNYIPSVEYKYKLQGFLFPSTYEFYKTSTAHEVIDKMLNEFEKQYISICDNYENVYTNVITASLIEREALLDSERKTISGVIKNRMEADMLLQIDASVVYAITDGEYNLKTVTYSDLKTTSLYNTYKYKGLPVGPICNPRLSSIKAAISPESHGYYYYHTDTSKNDGSHIFTENFDDHTNTMQ